jgi:ubiquinone biosynthesis monooxygenase Coq7
VEKHKGTGMKKRKVEQSELPGDLSQSDLVERFIRVNHAGEFGAKRIYEGQLAVLKNTKDAAVIEHMKDQELHHLETFEKLIVERKVRPTVLHPLWNVAGFALGVGTALLGPKAAMACTVAVEEVIDEHYADQAAQLTEDEGELRETINRFRDEELEHRDTAIDLGGETTPGYPVLRRTIRAGSKLAIWLSERL